MHEVVRATDDYSQVFERRLMSSTKVASTRPAPRRYQLRPLVHWAAANGRRSKSCSGLCRSGSSGGLPDTGGRVSRARLLASEVASAQPTQTEWPRRATVVATE